MAANRSRLTSACLSLLSQGIHSSFFKQELERWTELDVSTPFAAVFDEVWPLVQSMAQLLHHKDEVVGALLRALVEKNDVAFKPLLALLAVLGRDLRGELFPHFRRILDHLVGLIDPLKPARTGEVFRTLSHLFKYLAPQLLANLDVVRGYYGPLLGHERGYVREFAAQSFAFLLRKLPTTVAKSKGKGKEKEKGSMGTMAAHTASLVRAMGPQAAGKDGNTCPPRPQALRDGVALLLAEACKGVQYGFHSQMATVLSAALAVCRPKAVHPTTPSAQGGKQGGKAKRRGSRGSKSALAQAADPAAVPQRELVYATALARRFAVVERAIHILAEHTKRDRCDDLWQVLHTELDAALARAVKAASVVDAGTGADADATAARLRSETACRHVQHVLCVMGGFARHRWGTRITPEEAQRLYVTVAVAVSGSAAAALCPSRGGLTSACVCCVWCGWDRPNAVSKLVDSAFFLAETTSDSCRTAVLHLVQATWKVLPSGSRLVVLRRILEVYNPSNLSRAARGRDEDTFLPCMVEQVLGFLRNLLAACPDAAVEVLPFTLPYLQLLSDHAVRLRQKRRVADGAPLAPIPAQLARAVFSTILCLRDLRASSPAAMADAWAFVMDAAPSLDGSTSDARFIVPDTGRAVDSDSDMVSDVDSDGEDDGSGGVASLTVAQRVRRAAQSVPQLKPLPQHDLASLLMEVLACGTATVESVVAAAGAVPNEPPRHPADHPALATLWVAVTCAPLIEVSDAVTVTLGTLLRKLSGLNDGASPDASPAAQTVAFMRSAVLGAWADTAAEFKPAQAQALLSRGSHFKASLKWVLAWCARRNVHDQVMGVTDSVGVRASVLTSFAKLCVAMRTYV